MAVRSRFGAMTLRGLSAYRYAPLYFRSNDWNVSHGSGCKAANYLQEALARHRVFMLSEPMNSAHQKPQLDIRTATTTGGAPHPPPPPWTHSPQTKVTIVRKNGIYNRENLVQLFLVHNVLRPRPPV